MSNILTKTVKKVNILSIFVAAVLAIAIALGLVLGLNGLGVFNKDAQLKDAKTLTVSVSQYVYNDEAKLEVLEDACEEAIGNLKVAYKLNGEMSGDTCEIVYVFASDADLTAAKAALQAKASELTAENGALYGFTVLVAANSETATATLAKGYILRGVIAGVVLVVLVFAYVAVRYGLYMGITSAASTAIGTLLTTALIIITRLPVSGSVIYVIAFGALLSAIMTVINLGKIKEAKAEEGQTSEDAVISSIAVKEILLVTVLLGAALIVVGAVATAGVRWFAILSLIALAAAVFAGLVYAPALYIPFKKKIDSKPVEGAYVGAEKTSTRIKKIFAPKKKVVEAPVVEETTEEEVVEEEAEEAAEEVVEEEAEEVAEETAEEEVVEEAAEETQE